VPKDARSLAQDISGALEIPMEEAELYVSAIMEGRFTPKDAKTKAVAESLSSRGMLILDAKGSSYLAVHPRMALSNLFRAYEERAVRQRKEKRLLVDRLTLELIPLLPSESKGTNASGQRGSKNDNELISK
jgi:hypothetical protein